MGSPDVALALTAERRVALALAALLGGAVTCAGAANSGPTPSSTTDRGAVGPPGPTWILSDRPA